MAKQGSIQHYRQTGEAKAPSVLPYGELAIAKDGTLYIGNETSAPVQAGIQVYVHTYDATEKQHHFTGGGENGRTLVTAAISAGDTFAVNGTVMPAYTGEDETNELPVGRWVSFTCDGTQLNFNAGGSGVDFKVIAAATAQALPTQAREKTLAVLTDRELAGYALSPTTPAAVEGRVWVKTQPVPVSEGNAFNAVKKAERAIEVLIAGVYQFTDSEWVAKAAKLYLGGAWQNVTYSVTYAQGRAGTFVPQVKAELVHGAATPAFTGTVTKLPGFTFTGWSPAVADTVTEATSYTALFNQDQYFVRYLPGAQGTFAMQSYQGLRYGAARPMFQGAVTGNGLYDFAGWSPALATTVSGSVDYTAQWVHSPYYFSNGNEMVSKTGGWVPVPYYGLNLSTEFTKNGTQFIFRRAKGNQVATLCTNYPVNLTGVSYVNFIGFFEASYPENSVASLAVCTTKSFGGGNFVAHWSFAGAYGQYSHSGTISLDVRALTGNYYIAIGANAQSYYVGCDVNTIYGS